MTQAQQNQAIDAQESSAQESSAADNKAINQDEQSLATCTAQANATENNDATQSLFEEFNLDDIEVIESKVFA
jgi:hypothetical protein